MLRFLCYKCRMYRKVDQEQRVPGFTRRSLILSFKSFAGVTVFLCGLAIAALGHFVNAPTVMLANFIATPIELSLMVVFLRFGEFLTGGPHFPLTSNALKKVMRGEASMEIVRSILHALLGWLVLAPIILGTLYIILLPCFVILVHKFSNVSSPKASASSTELRLRVRDT
ncbi:hypothetical protein Ccrd_023518 [Cynara cardunculus var. scolymus]|uniref:Uncharacterized protein n=1 Tax=Cynara cardunculus var. scolymus TaxID=59895 RepID=A0A103XWJ6_CYNCS|nr:hypothetical protein Ccrd_023518 [Cynara cardunculus var. scolymus]